MFLRDYLTSGEDEHEVFELNGIKMGLLICELPPIIREERQSLTTHLGRLLFRLGSGTFWSGWSIGKTRSGCHSRSDILDGNG
jgi:hypothetical protein